MQLKNKKKNSDFGSDKFQTGVAHISPTRPSYPYRFKVGAGAVVDAKIIAKPLHKDLVREVLGIVCLPGQYGHLPDSVFERACALSDEVDIGTARKLRTTGMILKRMRVYMFR